MALNVINPYQIFRDSTGAVRANGWVSFFVNTTSALGSIYSDEDLTVTQTNPYNLDAYGRIIGDVKFSGLMTLQESNADGSDVITTDHVTTTDEAGLLRADLASTTATEGASLVSFESGKTVEDLWSTDTDDGTEGFHLVSYPPLTGETGVVNYEYPVGHISRYGTNTTPGTTDMTTALANAMTSVAALGGGFVDFQSETYLIGSALAIPANVTLRGQGKNVTILKRGFTGDFATQAGYSGLEHLTIDGDTATQGTGRGITFTGVTPNAHHLLIEIKNFILPCLDFGTDAGATFRGLACDYYTTGATGVVGAVTVSGTDTGATSRHFTNCESGGSTLFDFGGCNDFYVTGGFSTGLITSVNTSKALVNNMRIGGASTTTISGGNSRFTNCVFAAAVIIDGTGINFDCEVPDDDITDNGTGNLITQSLVAYTCLWTATGTDPAIGNGTLNSTFSRQGNKIKVLIDLIIGSTTTVGTNTWEFSLPRIDHSSYVQMCGSGFVINAAGTESAVCAVRVSPGNQLVTLFYSDTAAAGQNVGATNPAATWGNGATIRFFCEYITT